MLKLKLFLLSLLLVIVSVPASADWQRQISGTAADLTGGDLVVNKRFRNAYYRFTTNTNSSPLYIPNGVRVRITLNDNTGSPTRGTNTTACQILYLNHVDGTAWSLNDASPLLGVTLDGVASTGGVTNDTIWDVEGPMWIVVDPTALPASNAAYVAVVVMGTNE